MTFTSQLHLERRLAGMVASSNELMDALAAARLLGLQSWCIGAGAVRSLVWDALHGFERRTVVEDMDLVYFDADAEPENDVELEKRLRSAMPEVRWEVTNQAGVHRWFARDLGQAVLPIKSLADGIATWPEFATCVGVFCSVMPGIHWEVTDQAGVHRWFTAALGQVVPPLTSMEEGVGTWPEFATCVGVYLDEQDAIGVVAPHGLDDLFGLRVRHNPTRASIETYRQRVQSKRFGERWPGLSIDAVEGRNRARRSRRVNPQSYWQANCTDTDDGRIHCPFPGSSAQRVFRLRPASL